MDICMLLLMNWIEDHFQLLIFLSLSLQVMTNFTCWTSVQVCQWLRDIDLGEFCETFVGELHVFCD